MRFLTANLDALLVELDDLPQTLALLASLRAEPIAGVEEIVPAARTLLLRFAPAQLPRAQLVEQIIHNISQRSLSATVERADTLVEIPVDYQGEDLDEVAQLTGLSRAEVIAAHTGSDYTVAFTGFAPGFAYLSGGDARLNVPRRSTPRTRIPAGAVGLAGPFSGVYPQASPGGWQIIGVTATPMWDLHRAVPALLQPGFRVRFVDVSGQPLPPTRKADTATAAPVHTGPALVIRRSGLQALIQDLGRSGYAGQGVSASGAMDRSALRAANRLVGNASDAACVEIVDGGFELQSQGDTVLAVAGADAPLTLTTPDGRRSALLNHQAIALSDGDRLTLGEPRAGTRSYLAVRGGFAITPVLGSRSTDTLSGVGPPALKAGDVLPVQAATHGVVGAPAQPRGDLPTMQQVVTLDVVPGPRSDWFSAEAISLLASQSWTVTPQSNRVGLRLAGALPLARAKPGELPSEGVVLGALQVPPSGQPVLFLADHPLTGGYPVIAAVAPYDLDRAGQIPIGASLRFNILSDTPP